MSAPFFYGTFFGRHLTNNKNLLCYHIKLKRHLFSGKLTKTRRMRDVNDVVSSSGTRAAIVEAE